MEPTSPGEPAKSSPVDAVAVHEATEAISPLRPLFINRKYDFSGYISPIEAENESPEQTARPEPPDLPVPR
jgi:hypothetical protein